MNKNFKRSLAVISAVALAFGVVAGSSAQAAVKTFSIAYQGPLSGGEASTGIDEINAVKYAVKLFNAANKGFNIKVVAVDDQGDPAVASVVAPGTGANKNKIGRAHV